MIPVKRKCHWFSLCTPCNFYKGGFKLVGTNFSKIKNRRRRRKFFHLSIMFQNFLYFNYKKKVWNQPSTKMVKLGRVPTIRVKQKKKSNKVYTYVCFVSGWLVHTLTLRSRLAVITWAHTRCTHTRDTQSDTHTEPPSIGACLTDLVCMCLICVCVCVWLCFIRVRLSVSSAPLLSPFLSLFSLLALNSLQFEGLKALLSRVLQSLHFLCVQPQQNASTAGATLLSVFT